MRRPPPLLLAFLAGLLLPAVPAAAAGEQGAAAVKVGRVQIAEPPGGTPALLVPVTYPVELAGQRFGLLVGFRDREGALVGTRTLSPRLSAGPLRSPDRRKRFTFVHRVGGGPRLAAILDEGGSVEVVPGAGLDLDGDGLLDSGRDSGVRRTQALPLLPARAKPICSTVPALRVRAGTVATTPLPTCSGTAAVSWRIGRKPTHGRAGIVAGKLRYSAPKRFRGADSLALAAPGAVAPAPVRITVASSAEAPVVRALGDSVTAGFGYYDEGALMGIGSLLECKPAEKFYNDACSSNSEQRTNKPEKVEYSADYGLAVNISWAAQWANAHGVTNFKNFAVSGSEPVTWLPGGQLAKTLSLLASEEPDYVLMTMGGNPLLSEMLFGVENMGCAIYADVFGAYEECVEEAFGEVKLAERLRALYSELVKRTDAQIYLMQYHLSVPSVALAYSSTQIAQMIGLLNREIAAAAAAVSRSRLTVVTPPHFDVGISIEPVYPSTYSCSSFGFTVDGTSVQSTATQRELELFHYPSFCRGPKGRAPWIISGDTGIHPSAAGYEQMAARVPAPR